MTDPLLPAGGDPSQPLQAERRQWLRHVFPRGSSPNLVVGVESPPPQVQIINLSAGGACLSLGPRITIGQVVTVTLYNRARNAFTKVQFQVTHLGEEQGGELILGGAFLRDLGPDELQALS